MESNPRSYRRQTEEALAKPSRFYSGPGSVSLSILSINFL